MAKGQPLPPGSPLQLRGLQRAGHSSNWAIARIGLSLGPFGQHRQDEAKKELR